MRRLVLALFCASALAGCGTTVTAPTGDVAAPAGDGLGAPVTTPTDNGGAPSSGPVAPGVSPGAAGPAAAPGPGAGGSTGPVAGGVPSSASQAVRRKAANVPGVTDTTVKIGIEHISTEELAAFGDAAGVEAVGRTDMLAAYRAAVDAVNKAGGVAGGRRLVIVARERSAAESNAEAAQKSCAAFTEDDRVLLANPSFVMDSPAVPCLTSRGVLSLSGANVEGGSQKDFQRYAGRYVAPGTVETVAAARGYVDALVRQQFLTRTSRVGLLWFDFADFRAAKDSGLVPTLRGHGLGLASEFRATYSGNPADLGQIAAQMQSAVLQFRQAGVDRVLTLDYQGTLQYFFMNNAESQGYRPTYGLATWSDAEFLRANSSAAQLAGSTGIGWMPAYDLAVRQLPLDDPKKRCLAVMKAASMPPLQAQTDSLIQLRVCAEVFFMQQLLNTATDLSPAGLAAAAAALGNQPSYVGFAERFAADKRWGGAAYRDLGFDTGCTCFTYRGPNRPF